MKIASKIKIVKGLSVLAVVGTGFMFVAGIFYESDFTCIMAVILAVVAVTVFTIARVME